MAKIPRKPCTHCDTCGLCIYHENIRLDNRLGIQCDKEGRCIEKKVGICKKYWEVR